MSGEARNETLHRAARNLRILAEQLEQRKRDYVQAGEDLVRAQEFLADAVKFKMEMESAGFKYPEL